MLISFGYLGVRSDHGEDWASFAKNLLGMEACTAAGGGLELRMDERRQRVFVEPGRDESVACTGWEVADARALAKLADRLSDADCPVERGSAALAARRGVRELIVFADPNGNRLEAFWGAEQANRPMQPGRSISGFRTGELGLGHAVLTVASAEAVIPFYRDLLGFKLSDYALRPFRAYFFHLNARHHSFAVVETGNNGFHHLMVELRSLDDVGQAYDLAQQEQDRVGVTLGRHTNDFMTSFYAWSPSGFLVEYGWGGRSIDPESWRACECDYGPSLWGHERSWLPPAKCAEALALRLHAARAGQRAPAHVLAGFHVVMER